MTVISQCLKCKHFNPEYQGDNRCDAFPEGIPASVRWNEVDHRQPVEGDHDIQFEAHPQGIKRFEGISLPDKPSDS